MVVATKERADKNGLHVISDPIGICSLLSVNDNPKLSYNFIILTKHNLLLKFASAISEKKNKNGLLISV